jgi:enoyl-CoA hydratase/carnithine racemase
LDLGLFNRVVPPEDVMKEALSLARELAEKPRLAIIAANPSSTGNSFPGCVLILKMKCIIND